MQDRPIVIALPMLLAGGTEVQTLHLAKALLRDGSPVVVCCYCEHDPDIVARFESEGARVLLLGWHRREGLARLIGRLWRLFRSMRPSGVHVQYVAPGFAGVIAARLAGVPRLLATVHARNPGRKAQLLLRAATALCDGVQCVSRGVEEHYFGASRVPDVADPEQWTGHYTLYNCVETMPASEVALHRERMRSELQLGSAPVIGIVGRIAPGKGHAVLLTAFRTVIGRLPEAKVLVVGDGPERSRLQALANDLGVAESVRWLGRRTPDEALRTYAAMDVLAVPSLSEGFGLVAAEAMAAGCPVVASDVAGLSEVVAGGQTGLLVAREDTDAWAAGLLDVLLDPERAHAMGQAARQRIDALFSIEKYTAAVRAAYAARTR